MHLPDNEHFRAEGAVTKVRTLAEKKKGKTNITKVKQKI